MPDIEDGGRIALEHTVAKDREPWSGIVDIEAGERVALDGIQETSE